MKRRDRPRHSPILVLVKYSFAVLHPALAHVLSRETDHCSLPSRFVEGSGNISAMNGSSFFEFTLLLEQPGQETVGVPRIHHVTLI